MELLLTSSLVFQQIEIDHIQGPAHHCVKFETGSNESLPIFRLYGITPEQHSVMVHVHGFLPYFYIPCPSLMTEADLDDFQSSLEMKMRESDSSGRPLFGVEMVNKTNVYGFIPKSTQQRYLRITCTSSNAMNSAKSKRLYQLLFFIFFRNCRNRNQFLWP